MAPSDARRSRFVNAYTRMLVSSWADEAYAHRLLTEPVAALAEAGILLPANASVQIIQPDTAAADAQAASLDEQLAVYEDGLRTNHFVFYVPLAPQLTTEIIDDDELADVAAGIGYCCCCPCCCS